MGGGASVERLTDDWRGSTQQSSGYIGSEFVEAREAMMDTREGVDAKAMNNEKLRRMSTAQLMAMTAGSAVVPRPGILTDPTAGIRPAQLSVAILRASA